jgi:hypothetical protein
MIPKSAAAPEVELAEVKDLQDAGIGEQFPQVRRFAAAAGNLYDIGAAVAREKRKAARRQSRRNDGRDLGLGVDGGGIMVAAEVGPEDRRGVMPSLAARSLIQSGLALVCCQLGV